ncbi:MAG TPA: hypothetical protein VME01_03580 [Solirubrobacteraceae bacterium]|nr:hypothetical protein [Solirubrobacteraceae bacterium]
MNHHREILAALERLKSGASALTSEQYLTLLQAIEQAAEALHAAPRGSDPVATGLWWNHERTPALARLADALVPHPRGAATAASGGPLPADDASVARALHQSLLDNVRR